MIYYLTTTVLYRVSFSILPLPGAKHPSLGLPKPPAPPPPKLPPPPPPVAKSLPAGGMGPPPLSEGAVYKRLNRVVNTPVGGKFRVGDDIRDQWKDLTTGGRKKLMNIFADCNYDPDRVVKQSFCFKSMLEFEYK